MYRLFSVAFLLIAVSPVFAGKRWWIATATANWNSTTNWSSVSATGAGGASVPGTSDTAYFTSSRNGNCTINAAANVRRLEVQSGHTGTLTQSSGITVSVQNGNAQFSGGTFSGGNSNIVINGSLTISGGSFTSTSATLSTTTGITLSSGTFTHNSGTVDIKGSAQTITGNFSFYKLRFLPSFSATYTIASGTTITVNNTLTYANNAPNNVQLNTGNLHAKGDIVLSGTATGNGGNAIITVNGTGSQTLQGGSGTNTGALPNLAFNKSSGTLTLTNTVCVTGYISYVNGTISAGTSTVSLLAPSANNSSNNFVDPASPNGSVSFHHVRVSSGTRTVSGGAFVVNGNLTIASGATYSPGTNNTDVYGEWNNSGTFTTGTGIVSFKGSAYQKIIKSSGTEAFYQLTVNKTGGSLTLNCPSSISNQLTLTSGKVKTTAANYIQLLLGATLSGGSESSYVCGPFRRGGLSSFTFPLGDTALTSGAYHPLAFTTSGTGIPVYEASYKASAQTQGSTFNQDSLEEISSCEYWTFQRISGTTTAKVTLNWNTNNCVPEAGPAGQRVTRWTGTLWENDGNSGYTVGSGTGSVTANVFNAFSALTYVTLARRKEDQFFILNTLSMDSLIGSDSVKYRISGPQLSGIYKTGRVKTFKPYTPNIGGTSTVYLKFFQGSLPDTTTVQFDIDHYAKITNVKVQVDVLTALDTNFYDVLTDTLLALMNDRHTYAEQQIPPVFVVLEAGVRMSPDGDSNYDTFTVSGASGYTTYQLVISDAGGNTIYTTTNPASAWNGLDGGGNLVPQGSYTYQLTLDSSVLTGLFLVEY